MTKATPALARFWAKVQKTDTCWLWMASTDGKGYGQFRTESMPASPVKAHRYAYEQAVGPVPDGAELDHLCRVRGCVRPSHLEPVSGLTNTLRGQGPSAENARKTHCIRGHELPPRISIKGRRPYCRPCKVEADRRYKAKLRQRAT